MYLIRRIWTVTEPRNTRRAASLAAEMAKLYEADGRSDTTVFFNGGSVPGERGIVFMEWTSEVIESPYRADTELPPDPGAIRSKFHELTSSSRIEFFEVLTPDKSIPDG